MYNSESKSCAKTQSNPKQASTPTAAGTSRWSPARWLTREHIYNALVAFALKKVLDWAWPYILDFLGWAWNWLVMHVHLDTHLHFLLSWGWWLVKLLQTLI